MCWRKERFIKKNSDTNVKKKNRYTNVKFEYQTGKKSLKN